MKEFEKITIDGTKYVVLGTMDDGRLELVDDTRLDYAVGLFARKLTCPTCNKEFYVLDSGKMSSCVCPECASSVEIKK
ncbi:MAG: hypothetical protein ACTTKS_06450 [Bulleidia sp.]